MEEKESPVSGSTGGISGAESPAVSGGAVAYGGGGGALPQVMNFSVNMNVDGSLGPATGGGGVLAFGGGGSGDLLVKKKRGRPRKYDADGNLRVPYKSPPAPGFCFSSPSSAEFSSSKRGRGRPPGSGNWQMLASLGELFAQTAGGDFTPHVVTVSTGEDVAAKIISFSQKGPRGVCVLSANGAVSNVTIRQPGSSGGLLTYEGRFEILSLTGSYTVTENGGVRSRSGGLSVSLASPDGRVIGGGVAGLLVAASPIQMVVGSFKPNGFKTHKRKHYYEPRTTPFFPGSSDTATPATPISQAAPNTDSYPIPTSQLPVQSHGEADNNMSDGQNPNTSSDSGDWNGSNPHSAPRTYPDINVSVLVD